MDEIQIQITDGTYKYGNYVCCYNQIDEFTSSDANLKNRKKRRKFYLDASFVHYLMKELRLSEYYRFSFMNYNTYRRFNTYYEGFVFVLEPTNYDLIDYNWNDRIYVLTREKQEMDHTLSWLSTLGGAFSALGDYSMNCAVKAGAISIHQLKLALRLRDPTIQARCKLYFSLSLIQRKYFKLARSIIHREFTDAKSSPVVDTRLINMCKGIWAKLQYEQRIARKKRRA